MAQGIQKNTKETHFLVFWDQSQYHKAPQDVHATKGKLAVFDLLVAPAVVQMG